MSELVKCPLCGRHVKWDPMYVHKCSEPISGAAKMHERHGLPPHTVALDAAERARTELEPIPMRLHCPSCGELHVDQGRFATMAHHTHACQACGMVWRPCVEPTVGVRFLPGFRDADSA